MQHSDGGMGDTVKRVGLNGGVVNHIFEDNFFAHLQLMVERPIAHPVARETAVAAEAVKPPPCPLQMEGGLLRRANLVLHVLGATHLGIIGHLQTVGHVAGEADVEDGGADALVLYDVNHAADQRTGLPGKGAAWFEDNLQVGIALMETLHETHQSLDVVVLARHQMATAEVNPLYLREPLRKLLLNMLQRALKDVGAALTMTMAMEATNVAGQLLWQLVGSDAKAGAWGTRVVEQCLYLRIFGIDAQAQRALPCPLVETLILRQRVERQMTGAAHDVVELVVFVSRRIGMCFGAKLLQGQTGLAERAGSSRRDILAEDGERLPQGKGLKGKNPLRIGATGNLADKSEVAPQQRFFNDIDGSLDKIKN